jgi:glutathione synthase/RimK-type ligase-like ATP-grasp enzyme
MLNLRLAILTAAADEPRFAQIVERWFERLAGALRGQAIEAEARRWTDPGDLGGFDAIAPLLAWSYHERPDEWRALLDGLERSGARVVNGVDVLRWNTCKTYLSELESAGAPVVPTLFVSRLTAETVAQAHDRFGPDLIAKPQISGGSHQTVRLAPGDHLQGAPAGPAMLQPFMPSVSGEGELSLLFFDGVFSHAVGKVAKAGDFRVQFQHGGLNSGIVAPPEALAAAERVLTAAGRPLTYARVDLIRDPQGGLRLMELEAIEPDLYLEFAPDGGAAFARATRRAMEAGL